MISSLSIENIKTFKQSQEIKLAPITIFIGENGVGKSTFLQTLAVLRQSSGNTQFVSEPVIREANFQHFANDSTKPIRVSIKGRITPQDVTPFDYLSDLSYEMSWDTLPSSIQTSLKLISNKIDKDGLAKLSKSTNTILETTWNQGVQKIEKSIFIDPKTNNLIEGVQLSCAPSFPPVLGFVQMPGDGQMQNTLQRVIGSINSTLVAEFQRVFFVPALRGMNLSQYALEGSNVVDFVNQADFRVQAQRLASALEYNREEVSNKISDITMAVVNRKTRTRLLDGPTVVVETQTGTRWVRVMNEGFGANPLIQLAFQLVSTPVGSTLLIKSQRFICIRPLRNN